MLSQREQVDREHRLLEVLYRMEERGIPFDAATAVAAAERLEREADEIERTLPFTCSPKGIRAYFIDELGLTADRYSEQTNAPSLDEQQMRDWAAKDVPHAREYMEVRKRRVASSMWYRGYTEKLGSDGRLRTVFKQAKVKSGRMSVGRVQLQAMPKSDKLLPGMPDVRKLVVSEKPGHGIWNVDLSQAELRVASRYSKCMEMLRMLKMGVDFHAKTCTDVMRIGPDHPDWKNKRDIAKRLNFSGIFMIGPKHFQEIYAKMTGTYLPMEECEDLVWGWRRLYPEFEKKYKHSMRLAETQGWVPQLPGTELEERSYFGPIDYSNTAWNRVVQGSLALFFKHWMIFAEQHHPGKLILTVHDSLMLECHESEGQEIAEDCAAWAARRATDLFDIEMRADVDRWS